MDSAYFLLLSIFLFPADTGAAVCENGWTAYKDEICIQAFPNLLTYDEAKTFCASQADAASSPSLVLVKEAAMQEFLVNYTLDIFDNLWLGGRYDEEAADFLWEDGDSLTYTNWQEGSPRNGSDSSTCIDLRPINSKVVTDVPGKWSDVNCQRRSMVMCQKKMSWSLQDAIGEILKIRKELEEVDAALRDAILDRDDLRVQLRSTRDDLQVTMENLQATSQDLQTVRTQVVPVGSIYIEYNRQPSPRTLWPTLTWEDISSTFAGLFFRVYGDTSGGWGSIQDECAPRIADVYKDWHGTSQFDDRVSLPSDGMSRVVHVGRHFFSGGSDIDYEGLYFNVSGCEVRPRNLAVRVWKRTA